MKTKEEIIQIAIEQARKFYRDLSVYNIEANRKGSIWEVKFLLKQLMPGGGPHYEIDAETGKILRSINYQ
jgi:uncharacterized membrane protein YkoI